MTNTNFIFILIDDLGWRDLGCYGSTFYETPNIDRLAAQGMRFTDAYAAAPVCSPTRASLMTGKYPARVGITDWIGSATCGRLFEAHNIDHLPSSEISLGRAFKNAGYQTWHVGKWHLGAREYYPDKHGFDVNIGGCHFGGPVQGYFSPYGLPTLPDGPPGEYLTDRLTDEAIRLIERADSRPFFLNLWHYAVHTPIEAKQKDIEKYIAKSKSLGLDQAKTFEEGEFFPCEHKKGQRVIRRLLQSDAAYAALIENLDWNIGRLLQALDASGRAQNTVVVFTSDNGGLATAEGSPTCNAPLAEGKGWMYEGGIREPLFIRWPGVTLPGSVCTEPVITPDFYPTLLDVAGLPAIPEQHVDGRSIVPILKGAPGLVRDSLFWHYPHYGNQGGTPASVLRAGPWKLIEFYENPRVELYNLPADLSEQHDQASAHPDIAAELQRRLHEWHHDTAALMPQPNPEFRSIA